jgi:hypothetical protein
MSARDKHAPAADSTAEVSSATPVAAAFLLGCAVPEHARAAARKLVLHTDMTTTHNLTDGSKTWSWFTPELSIELTVTPEGLTEGRIRVADESTRVVDGDVVRYAKEITP